MVLRASNRLYGSHLRQRSGLSESASSNDQNTPCKSLRFSISENRAQVTVREKSAIAFIRQEGLGRAVQCHSFPT